MALAGYGLSRPSWPCPKKEGNSGMGGRNLGWLSDFCFFIFSSFFLPLCLFVSGLHHLYYLCLHGHACDIQFLIANTHVLNIRYYIISFQHILYTGHIIVAASPQLGKCGKKKRTCILINLHPIRTSVSHFLNQPACCRRSMYIRKPRGADESRTATTGAWNIFATAR